MQACLSTGAYCTIDIHNFARFNGQIIGQSSGGPTDAQFADLWSQLATKYLNVDNSGEHAECTTDNIADTFQLVADFLRQNRRQAIVSETGAGSTSSCFTDFCA